MRPASAQAPPGQRGPGVPVEAERPVEAVADGETVGGGERDQGGRDAEGKTLDADADLGRFAVAVADGVDAILPIRLTPMTATCRVPPLSRVKLGIGWSRGVARDAEQ